jgi:hypothetical protein
MGQMLLLVGALIAVVGSLWLLVKAFQTSVWWGLGSLFIPFVQLIFVIMNWAECKKPFLILIAGAVLCGIGVAMVPHAQLAQPPPP